MQAVHAPGVGGVVVEYDGEAAAFRPHEQASRAWISARLAKLKGYRYPEPEVAEGTRLYVVPVEALEPAEAANLGVASADDLFGGVVPHAFVATKSITHPLVSDPSCVPYGWSTSFAPTVRDIVLDGYTAFSVEDARCAGRLLLKKGAARIKPSGAKGSLGQATVHAARELDETLEKLEAREIARMGVVLEEEVDEMRTCSIGQVEVAGIVASYCGTQRATMNGHGAHAYGGSDLIVARGGYDALAALDLPPGLRLALEQARRFDEAALAAYPGLYKSRTNYDVLQGSTGNGSRSGVLEQSWRPGGASAAEVAALEAFQADPGLDAIKASTREVYGECGVPDGAHRIFEGVDERAGRLSKYCWIEEHGNPQGTVRDRGR